MAQKNEIFPQENSLTTINNGSIVPDLGVNSTPLEENVDIPIARLRAELVGQDMPAAEKEKPLSLELGQQLEKSLLDLKHIIDTRELSVKTKQLLLDAEVIAVIAGIKPASYIQPQMEKLKWRFMKVRDGLSVKDIKEFQSVLVELGVDSAINGSNDPGAAQFKDEVGCELLHIWKKDQLIQTAETSGLFDEGEMDLIKNDPAAFFDYMDGNKMGYAKVFRVGVLYGYPLVDVADEISLQQIEDKYNISCNNLKDLSSPKNSVQMGRVSVEDRIFLHRQLSVRKGVAINGVYGGVHWVTTNAGNEQVQRRIELFKALFEMQEEILGNKLTS